MEDFENKMNTSQEPDTVFSKAILSRKRIYYFDVKKNRNSELFITITERKKILSKNSPQPVFIIEKHKIFLYKEDFDNFCDALSEAISYIEDCLP